VLLADSAPAGLSNPAAKSLDLAIQRSRAAQVAVGNQQHSTGRLPNCLDRREGEQGPFSRRDPVSDPARLARLLIAARLAYVWIIYLGVIAKRDDWVKVIHRTDRCDLSLFQLGLNLLDHFLYEHIHIPVAFQMPRLAESVR
jgi:hypothetical protein